MKIHSIRIKNLNSLRGEFCVDFRQAPLDSASLYAITGPTGAGKTTILDAITLALYGSTARLGRSPEEVMSHGTGECSAEVEFETEKGIYRSTWMRARAKGKSDGKIQPPKLTLARINADQVGTDEVLTSKIEDSQKAVEDLTGLNAKQFQRSVLLAQGDFAAFLHAKDGERADLLEQITGTDLYKRISERVYKKADQYKVERNQLTQNLQLLQHLTDAERNELSIEKKEADLHAETLKKQIDTLIQQIGWRETEIKQLQALEHVEAAYQQAQQAHKQAEPKRQQLAQHNQAQHLAADLKTWKDVTSRKEKAQTDLLDSEKKTANSLKEKETAQRQYEIELQKRESHKSFKENREIVLNRVAGKDSEIQSIRKNCEESGQQAQNLKKQTDEQSRSYDSILQQQQQRKEKQQQIQAVLDAHARLDSLIEPFNGLKVIFEQWEQAGKGMLGANRNKLSYELNFQELQEKQEAFDLQLKEKQETLTKLTERISEYENKYRETGEEKEIAIWRAECEKYRKQLDVLKDQLRIAQDLQDIRQKMAKRTAQQKDFHQKLQDSQTELVRLSDSLSKEKELKEAIEKNIQYLATIASLEDHRHNLKSGKECPLCGALEHPFAANLPEQSGNEESKRLQAVKDTILILEKKEKDAVGAEKQNQTRLEELARNLKDDQAQEQQWATDWQKMASDSQPEIPVLTQQKEHTEREMSYTENIIQKLEGTQKDIDKEKKNQEKLQEDISNFNAQKVQSDLAQAGLKKDIEQTEKEIGRFTNEHHSCAEKLNVALQPAGEKLPETDASQWFHALEKQLQDFAKKRKENESLKQEIEKASVSLESSQNDLKRLQSELAEAKTRFDNFKASGIAIKKERDDLAGSAEDTETLRKQLKELSEGIEKAFEAARNAFEAAEQNLKVLNSKWESLQTELKELKEQHELQTRSLITGAQNRGFESIEILQQALLLEEKANEINTLLNQLNEQLTATKTAKENCQQQATQSKEQTTSLPPLPDLQNHKTTAETDRENYTKRLGEIDQKLRSDAESATKAQAIEKELETAQAEFRRWDGLYTALGGQKDSFNRFAQSLTLERMILRANRHLKQIFPRYRIIRNTSDATKSLEMCIEDLNLANEQRSLKTLSGGETFVVSLGLALGLADLAGGKVRIDSLFIDEGFGSLDPETLEQALAALENLQATGKRIGVISHVEAMKERIRTQIQVHRKGEGVSTILVLETK